MKGRRLRLLLVQIRRRLVLAYLLETQTLLKLRKRRRGSMIHGLTTTHSTVVVSLIPVALTHRVRQGVPPPKVEEF